MKLGFGFLVMVTLALPSFLQARPVGFTGAFSLMSENSESRTNAMIHYTPHHRYSLGSRFLRVEAGRKDAYFGMGELNVLLHRWNHKDFQANAYAYGGLGAANYRDQNKLAYLGGGQLDAEDRRFFGMFKYLMLDSDLTHRLHTYTSRVGVAPYIGSYDELNTWIMLQYEHERFRDTKHELTPLVRFFYRNIMIEAGASIQGGWMFNIISEI